MDSPLVFMTVFSVIVWVGCLAIAALVPAYRLPAALMAKCMLAVFAFWAVVTVFLTYAAYYSHG